MKKRRAFTIIELVIVIGVIGVLSAILVPTFVHLTNKAHHAKDVATVTNINKVYSADKANNAVARRNTMYQAVKDIIDNGYQLKDIQDNSAGGYFIAWDRINDRFVLVDESTDTYMDGNKEVHIDNKYDFFRVYDEMPEEQDYSIYLSNKNVIGDITNLEVGFDAGDNNTVSKLIYNREGDNKTPRDVYIRTNSATDVELRPYVDSDGNGDNVDRYGDCNELINKGPNHSYHELGAVNHLSLDKGHFVLSSGTIVSRIYANASDGDISIELKKGSTVGTIENQNSTHSVTISAESGAQVINFEAHNIGGALNATFYNKPLYSNTLDCNETDYVIFGVGNKGVKECEMPSAETACPDDSHDYVAASGHSLRVCRRCGSYEYVEVSSDGVNETSSTYYFKHDGNDFVQINNSHTHHYGAPTWHWVDETKAIATFECSSDDCHNSISITAHGDDIERKQLVPDDCDNVGEYQYVATVNCEENVYKDEYDEIEYIDDIKHDYHFDCFEWDGPGNAKAVYVCYHDKNHITKYDAGMSGTVKTPATCASVGTTTYTASYGGYEDSEDYNDIDINPTAHNYEFSGFEWSEDHLSAQAVYVCSHNDNHVRKYDAVVTSTIVTEATYTHDGTTRYTATFDNYSAYIEYDDIPKLIPLVESKFAYGDTFNCYLGNRNVISVSDLFKTDVESMSVIPVSGTANGIYSNGNLTLTGLGVIRLRVNDAADFEYEVVDATNITSAAKAVENSVVLLNDISAGAGSIEVANGNYFYGNGYKITVSGNGEYLNSGGMALGFIDVSTNGVLDNVQLICKVFPKAYFYSTSGFEHVTQGSNETRVDGTKHYYGYQYSAVALKSNGTISNSFIYGARNNVYINGSCTIRNTVLENGSLSNIQISGDNSDTVVLDNVTTSQHLVTADFDNSVKSCGLGIISGSGDKDTINSETNPTIDIRRSFKQYNWFSNYEKNNVGTSLFATRVIESALQQDSITTSYNNDTYANSGILYLNNMSNTTTPTCQNYGLISLSVSGVTACNAFTFTSNHNVEFANYIENYSPAVQGNTSAHISYTGINLSKHYDTSNGGFDYSYTIPEDYSGTFVFDISKLSVLSKGENAEFEVTYRNNNTKVNTSTNITEAGIHVFDISVKDDNTHYSISITKTESNIDAPEITNNPTLDWVHLGSSGSNSYAIDVLTGLEIKYYNNIIHKVVTEKATDIFSTYSSSGKITDSNVLTLESNNRIKITITSTGGFHSSENNYNGYFYYVSGKFYAGGTNRSLGKSTMDGGRTTNLRYVIEDYVGHDSSNGTATTYNTSKTVSGTSGTYYNVDSFLAGNLSTSSPSSGGGSSGGNCLLPDTLITLPDGSTKQVKDVVAGDELRVFNHETGQFESSFVMFNDKEEAQLQTIINLEFSNGESVGVISEHGFFDMELMKYVYIREDNYQDYIGHRFYGENGIYTLDNAYLSEEYTEVYSPITFKDLNYLTNGMLSMPGGAEGLFNIFEYDSNLKYDEVLMQQDIETYGLLDYSYFEDMIPYEVYLAFNGKYLGIAMGKGTLTEEMLAGYVARYSQYW